jgi:hypothetical protein
MKVSTMEKNIINANNVGNPLVIGYSGSVLQNERTHTG